MAQHAAWIRDRRSQTRRTYALVHDGLALPLLGEALELNLVTGAAVPPQVRRRDGRLMVSAADPLGARDAIEGWCRDQARAHVAARVIHFGAVGGHLPIRVHVRGQRRRWGSCSTGGIISINRRLLQLPPRFLDYVATHELSHLEYPDHAPAFWCPVARICPAFSGVCRELRFAAESLVL